MTPPLPTTPPTIPPTPGTPPRTASTTPKTPDGPRPGVWQVLTGLSIAQASDVARRIGPFTEADLGPFMAEARAVHAAELGDERLPLDLSEWAVQRIAINRLARSRGYDVDRRLEWEAEREAQRQAARRP